jgi:hypothetical protein
MLEVAEPAVHYVDGEPVPRGWNVAVAPDVDPEANV